MIYLYFLLRQNILKLVHNLNKVCSEAPNTTVINKLMYKVL